MVTDLVHAEMVLTPTGPPPFTPQHQKRCLHLVPGLRKAGLPSTPSTGAPSKHSHRKHHFLVPEQQLNRTVKRASRVIDAPLRYLMEHSQQRCIRRAAGISSASQHPVTSWLICFPNQHRQSAASSQTKQLSWKGCFLLNIL